MRHGAAALQDSELLAIALRTGIPGLHVVELCNRLLRQFGGLRGLLGAAPEELMAVPGLGAAKACMLAALLELARRAVEEELPRVNNLDHPLQVKQYCKLALGHRRVEHCIALYLDNQLRLIATGELRAARCRRPRSTPGRSCARHCATMRPPSSWPTTIPRA